MDFFFHSESSGYYIRQEGGSTKRWTKRTNRSSKRGTGASTNYWIKKVFVRFKHLSTKTGLSYCKILKSKLDENSRKLCGTSASAGTSSRAENGGELFPKGEEAGLAGGRPETLKGAVK